MYVKIKIISSLSNGDDIYFLSDEGPMLETLDYTIRIGSTTTILYFDLYISSTDVNILSSSNKVGLLPIRKVN